MLDVILRLIPYGVAIVIGATDFPTRLIRARHRGAVDDVYLRFAARVSSAAHVIALPLVSLLFAAVNILQLVDAPGGAPAPAVKTCVVWGLVIYVLFVIAALWVLAANIAPGNEDRLPRVRLAFVHVRYDWLVRIVKVVGVLVPAVVDVFVTNRFAGP